MTLYIYLVIAFFAGIGLWDISLYIDTIFWYLGTATVLLINVNDAVRDDRFFYKLVRENIALIAILQVLISLYNFSLFVEIALVPIVVLLVGMRVVAERDKNYQAVKTFCALVLSGIGVILIIFTLSQIAPNIQSLYTHQTLQAFVTIPLLTFACLPFIYVVALWMEYEILFLYLNNIFKIDAQFARTARWKMILLCNVSLQRVLKLRLAMMREIPKMNGELGIQRLLTELESEVVLGLRISRKHMFRFGMIIIIAVLL